MYYLSYTRHKKFLSTYLANAHAPFSFEVCIHPHSKRAKLCYETPSAIERLIVFVPFYTHTMANRDPLR